MRTDKHKLLTVAYTDTVATCATAHVLIWRCRESLVGAIPYFLSYLTQRARETNTLEARDRQLGRQRRPRARAAEPAAEYGAGRRRQGKPRRLRAAGRPRVKTRRAWPHPPPAMACSWLGIARGKYGGKTARAGAHAPTAAKKGSRVFYAGVCAGQFICLPRGSTGERGCGMQDISCVRARAQSPMPKKLYKFYTLYILLLCLYTALYRRLCLSLSLSLVQPSESSLMMLSWYTSDNY